MIVTDRGRDDDNRPNLGIRTGLFNSIEMPFDHLSRLAARLLRAPIALISLSHGDVDEAFFQSGFGISAFKDDRPELVLAQSLSQGVIDSAQSLAIRDIRNTSPQCVGESTAVPGVIAYLGVPLKEMDSGECVLGVLCVIDQVPRIWTEQDVQDLETLGAVITREVVGLKAVEDILRVQSETLKDIDHRRDEFLSILGHELRSPLAAILSAIHLARQSGKDVEEIAWSHGVIERQSKQLVRLIDDLLDVSRIARGKIQLHKQLIALADVVDRATAVVRLAFERKNHELAVTLGEESLMLHADPVRLEQILVNLLNNAIKYTDEGGRIALQAERTGIEVIITVSDTGVGISAEVLPHVFDFFYRVPRPFAPLQNGLGIGLTLVKKLAEMHGGRVEAASEGPGKGSRFSVRLPFRAESPPKITDDEKSAPRGEQNLRILVVDDNVDSANSMAMLLRAFGHDVQVAYDGNVAIDVALDQRPDVVLLDIGLPGRDGYAVARFLRRDERCRDAFIVALSGYGQDEDKRRSREAGINAHLVKPVDVDELLRLLANP